MLIIGLDDTEQQLAWEEWGAAMAEVSDIGCIEPGLIGAMQHASA